MKRFVKVIAVLMLSAVILAPAFGGGKSEKSGDEKTR